MRFAGLGPIAEYDAPSRGMVAGVIPDGSPQKRGMFVTAITENFGVIGTIPKMKKEGLPCVTYSP